MLRTVGPAGSLFELLLPAGMRVLSGELARLDELLDDPRFFEPFSSFFSPLFGRPSIPIETYLRLMVLKYRTRLGYARLVEQVADSISWRRFCRIGLEARVPDESTIRKLTVRCGPGLVDALNVALLAKIAEVEPLDLSRVRVDSTVVPADVAYPTDSGLLARAISRIAVLVGRLDARGAAGFFCIDRTPQARRLAHEIGVWLRRRSDQAKAEVLAITGQLAALAQLSVDEAARVAAPRPADSNWAAALRRRLAVLVERARIIISQAETRVGGGQPDGATRLVSLADPDARPIRKGRLGRPVEFGYKAQAVDNPQGYVLDYTLEVGNPADTGLLLPAMKRLIDRVGVPAVVVGDRGYADARLETELHRLGVTSVVIPRNGKPSAARQAIERAPEFVEQVKWRTGCEGRISALKREHGWARTHLRGQDRARTWCAHGIFTHNLTNLTRRC